MTVKQSWDRRAEFVACTWTQPHLQHVPPRYRLLLEHGLPVLGIHVQIFIGK